MSGTPQANLRLGKKTALRPFDPKRIPFFYGWVVVAAGIVGVLMSTPGQTLGVSVFTDFLADALEMTRVRLSVAYLVGTISSALLLPSAGRLYDRYGARILAGIAAIGLGLFLLMLTRVDYAVSRLVALLPGIAPGIVAFVVIAFGFLGIRFFGQGVIIMSSNNMVVKWFDRRRGLAVGIVGVFFAFGFSATPKLFDSLITRFGWRDAWVVLAVIVGIVFPIIVVALFRDNPEQCEMRPDGSLPPPKIRKTKWKKKAPHPDVDATLQEARRTFSFWVFACVMFLISLYVTGFTFHVISIFEESGLSRSRAVSVFLPASFISVATRLLAGLISDYIKLKYLLILQIAGLALSSISLILLAPGLSIIGIIVGNGVASGLFGLLATITWPQFFGRAHLGAIAGFAIAIQVAGSAVGPYVFGLSLSVTGGYEGAGVATLVVAVLLLLGATRADQPNAGNGNVVE